jgi:hypothetical protein
MSLTGMPLILLAGAAVVVACAATVLTWGRWPRLRFVLRPAGVLLIEALLLFSIGLVVNRSEQFYPSWAALFGNSSGSGETNYPTTAGHLDRWLAEQAGAKRGDARNFAWKPSGLAGWDLTGEPRVFLPAGYLLHPAWRYSVVLVVGDAAAGWPATAEAAAATSAKSPVIIVYATTTPRTTTQTLITDLPNELGHDLRVTAHRWGIVASGAEATIAQQAVVSGQGRYPVFATVRAAAPPPVKPPTKKAGNPFLGAFEQTQKETESTEPPPGTEAIVFSTEATGPPHVTVPTLADGLVGAVGWVADRMPPPLAPSAPEVKYVAPPPRKPKPTGTPQAPGHEAPLGGPDGSGQPSR